MGCGASLVAAAPRADGEGAAPPVENREQAAEHSAVAEAGKQIAAGAVAAAAMNSPAPGAPGKDGSKMNGGGGPNTAQHLASGLASACGAAKIGQQIAKAMAGTLLLDAARACPFSAPLAYAIGTVVTMCSSAKALQADAATFADVVAEVEKILVKSGDLVRFADQVTNIQGVIDEAAVFLKHLQGRTKWQALILIAKDGNSFDRLRSELNDEVGIVALHIGADTAGLLAAKFHQEAELTAKVATLGGPDVIANDPDKLSEIESAMDASNQVLMAVVKKERERVKALEDESARLRKEMESRMQEQEAMMAKQAAQMQSLMETMMRQQAAQMQALMNMANPMTLAEAQANFPKPAHLIDQHMVLERRDIHKILGPDTEGCNADMPSILGLKSWVDSVTATYAGDGKFVGEGVPVHGLSFHVFRDENIEYCIYECRNDKDLGKAPIRCMSEMGYFPRIASPCQYSDNLGEMVCVKDFGQNKAMNSCTLPTCPPPPPPIAAKRLPHCYWSVLIRLAHNAVADMGAALMEQLKTMETFGVEEGKLGQQYFGNIMGAMGGARGADDKQLLEGLMMETGREGSHYIGVPLRLDGVAVGSICVFYRSEVSSAEAACPRRVHSWIRGTHRE